MSQTFERPIVTVSTLVLLAVTFSGNLSVGQQQTEVNSDPQEVERMMGERVDPSLYGPGIVESMQDVADRERNMPPSTVNSKLRNGRQGTWAIPRRFNTFVPHSGQFSVANTWGDTKMGIGFPGQVDVEGAWFAGQAGEGSWASAVRAHGYRGGELVVTTDWFTSIEREPSWFAMNLGDVDRIEIEAKPTIAGSGWYTMDDLTYSVLSDDPAEEPRKIVVDFEDASRGKVLTGSNYAGLTWETGTGDFDQAIPGPLPIETDKPEPAGPEAPAGEAGVDGGGTDGTTTPTLSMIFQGPISGGSFPPDTCGAIGPNHFVSIVNTNISAYHKATGALAFSQSLGAFFGGGSGDPRILYDTHSGRWIAIDTDFSTRIYLAVSTTNNPTGSWFKTNFVAMAGSDTGCSIDFPTLGVDQNGIYLSMWAVGCGYTFFAIDKAPLIAVTPSLGTVTAFRGLTTADTDPIPVHTYTAATGEYFLSGLSSTSFRLRRVNPPLNAPTLSTLLSITVPSHGNAPDAPAMGSTTNLDTGDTRLMNAVLRDGFIYTTHTINVSGRAAVRWYKINPTTSALVESGTVSSATLHYFYPSIAVNSVGDLAMGFTGSNASQFAACYFTGRSVSDPAGTMATPVLYKSGVASYNLLDGFGRNRWGDYSLTTLDPSDNLTFYTIQEYAHSTNVWGTFVAKLVISAAPANDNCVDAQLIGDGAFAFSTLNATTDGPDEPAQCSFAGQTNITRDIWYKYLASCTGTATVSLCGSSYNTKLAAYAGCPAGSGLTLACNDDFCGSSSQISFPVVAGTLYRVRIGGFNNASGAGTANISCTPAPPACPEDLSGDNTVGTPDLLLLINAWGPCGGCPADLTNDGTVGTPDLLQLINAWGPC